MNYQIMQSLILNTFHSLQSVDERKTLFDNFIGTLQAPKESRVLLESIRAGAFVLLENERDLRPYQRLASEIMDGVVSKFKDEGGGREMTRKLMDIIDHSKGRVNVDPIGGFGLVRSFEYYPDGTSTETDKIGAREILISSVFPMVLLKARELLKRSHDPEISHDFIVRAMEKLPEYLGRFKFAGSSFLNAFMYEMKNMERDGLAKANEIGTAERYWKKGTPMEKGKIVSFSGQNFRTLDAISGPENHRAPPDASNLWEPVGRSRKTSVSLDQPSGESESNLQDTIASIQYAAKDVEDKAELSKLWKLLPPGQEKLAIDYLYGLSLGRPISDIEAAEKLGVGRTAVHRLVKNGLDEIRKRSGIELPVEVTAAV